MESVDGLLVVEQMLNVELFEERIITLLKASHCFSEGVSQKEVSSLSSFLLPAETVLTSALSSVPLDFHCCKLFFPEILFQQLEAKCHNVRVLDAVESFLPELFNPLSNEGVSKSESQEEDNDE